MALISNCDSAYRNSYIEEIRKYLPLTIYGKCGKQCLGSECRELISRDFKFFFLFENSLCRDYITEKIFDTLKYDIIPVVMGVGNYSYYVPKSGFINGLDFDSPKKLADYLNYLNENKTAYNDYFKWKKYIKTDSNVVSAGYLCEMCIKLNLEENLGYVEKNELTLVKQRFGLFENCFQPKFEPEVKFSIKNLTQLIYSYYMSPENKR